MRQEIPDRTHCRSRECKFNSDGLTRGELIPDLFLAKPKQEHVGNHRVTGVLMLKVEHAPRSDNHKGVRDTSLKGCPGCFDAIVDQSDFTVVFATGAG
jgi:hypothetical protein